MTPLISIALILLAIALFILAACRQRAIGLPKGRVIYSDTRGWSSVEKPLYDAELMLTGRPDYLVKEKEVVIPVEVKSTPIRDTPYDGHIYQLAAYCLLVHRVMGNRPPYSLLHYPNKTFAIDYTNELEISLLKILAEIRQAEKRDTLSRSHNSSTRCNGCSFRSVCDQKI
ncbi:MAG: Dna2/Cas4 domain-containing protein [Chloroflexota bacterium]